MSTVESKEEVEHSLAEKVPAAKKEEIADIELEKNSQTEAAIDSADDDISEDGENVPSSVGSTVETKLPESESELTESEGEVEEEPEESSPAFVATMKNLVQYLQNQDAAKITCEITTSGTRKKKMSLTKTVVYELKINMNGEENTVWRVYDEFVLLHKALSKRLVGSTIPPLPHAFKAIQQVSEVMLEKRLKALKQFMEAAIRHPFISTESAFLLFTSSQDTITKKSLAALDESSSVGVVRWNDMVNNTRTPTKPAQQLKSTQTEVAAMHTFYVSLKSEVQALSAKLASYASTAEHFNSAFEEWKNLERKDLKLLKGIAGGKNSDGLAENCDLSKIIEQMQAANQDDKERILSLSQQILTIMKPSIKYEALALEALQKDFEVLKDLLSKHKKAVKVRRSLEAEAVKSGGDINSKKVTAARETEAKRKEEADFYSRATLVVEMNRYRFERAGRAVAIYHHIASLKAELAKQEMEEWTRVSNMMPATSTIISSDMYTLKNKSRSARNLNIV